MSCKKHIRWLVVLLVTLSLLLLLVACSTRTPAPITLSPVPDAASASIQSEGEMERWKEKWETWVREARKEGKVVIYSTAGDQARIDLGNAFKNRFGITVEYVSGVGALLTRKLLSER